MSSNPPRGYVDLINMAMLRDALRTADVGGVDADASLAGKHAASLFVNSQFRNGDRISAALMGALECCGNRQSDDLSSGRSPRGDS